MTKDRTILDQIAQEARDRVDAASASVSTAQMRTRAFDTPIRGGFPFEHALSAPGLSFICEVKKASPSKGLISPDFPYLEIAEDYEAGGAAAISVLTEPAHFLGADAYLTQITHRVSIPVLRKDFVVDAYQIFEARVLGASAVLLICSIISKEQLSEFLGLAENLGLSALVEAHDRTEVERAVRAGARVIGVNNRNLHDFSVDTSNSAALRTLVPPDRIFVSESGVATPQDAAMVAQSGADAVLVGEALMRATDRQGFLTELIQASNPDSRPAGNTVPAVKICGISRDDDVPVLNEMLPDYAGFVFHPASRRHVDLDTARHLRTLLDERITTVGVFVDAPIPQVVEAIESGAISMVQLHGSEDQGYIAALRRALPRTPIIKAVAASDAASISQITTDNVDYLMVDNARPGSGESFDWDVLGDLPTETPVFLAGGLTPDTVSDAARLGVYAVDVSSGVETDGVKDPNKIRAFISAARSVRNGGRP